MKQYQHSCTDKSLIGNRVLTPLWKHTATLLPRHVSPNMITFFGGLFMICTYIYITLSHNDLFVSPLHRHHCFLISLAWLVFLSCDGVDGAYARYSGMKSPLGDIIDHSIDAIVYISGGILTAALFIPQNGIITILSVLSAIACGYACEVEYLVTKTMTLGIISGPTEGVLIASLVSFIVGVIGPENSQRLFGSTVTIFGNSQKLGVYAVFCMSFLFLVLIIISFFKCLSNSTFSNFKCLHLFSPFLLIIIILIFLNYQFPSLIQSNSEVICVLFGLSLFHITNRVLIIRLCSRQTINLHFFYLFFYPIFFSLFNIYQYWFVLGWVVVVVGLSITYWLVILMVLSKKLGVPLIRTFEDATVTLL
ncbi:hypothetical protein P9112_006386 [Eukaryota sp. TZLM1-RC]